MEAGTTSDEKDLDPALVALHTVATIIVVLSLIWGSYEGWMWLVK